MLRAVGSTLDALFVLDVHMWCPARTTFTTCVGRFAGKVRLESFVRDTDKHALHAAKYLSNSSARESEARVWPIWGSA